MSSFLEDPKQYLAEKAIDVAISRASIAGIHWMSKYLAESKKFETSNQANISKYLKAISDRYRYVNSLIKPDSRHYLYDLFVAPDIQIGDKKFDTRDLSFLNDYPQILITGLGGCGKSTLVKHILLDTVKEGQRIPLFIELRKLNDKDGHRLMPLLIDEFKKHGIDVLEESAADPSFGDNLLLILDGFDELKNDLRSDVSSEIEAATSLFSGARCIVTSRPDPGLADWTFMQHARVQDLSREKSLELVSKFPDSTETREKFTILAEERLFDSHATFIANPLLLTLMFLVYSKTADVPTKDHLFYQQAFYLLWNEHDARKNNFKRDHNSRLDLADFERATEAFCYLTYVEEMFEIDSAKAVEYANNASTAVQIKVDSEAFVNDLVSDVCVLVRDGITLSFSHRSFQEYFSARFFSKLPRTQRERLIPRTFSRIDRDSLFKLLLEMSPRVADEDVASYYLADMELLSDLARKNPSDIDIRMFAKRVFTKIHIGIDKYENAAWHIDSSDGAFRRLSTLAAIADTYHNLCGFKCNCLHKNQFVHKKDNASAATDLRVEAVNNLRAYAESNGIEVNFVSQEQNDQSPQSWGVVIPSDLFDGCWSDLYVLLSDASFHRLPQSSVLDLPAVFYQLRDLIQTRISARESALSDVLSDII